MSAIKMDELLVSWLGSDDVYENVMELIENYHTSALEDEKKDDNDNQEEKETAKDPDDADVNNNNKKEEIEADQQLPNTIPPFYPPSKMMNQNQNQRRRRRRSAVTQKDSWEPLPESELAKEAPPPPPPDPPMLPKLGSVAEDSHNNPAGDGPAEDNNNNKTTTTSNTTTTTESVPLLCVRDQTMAIFEELGQDLDKQHQQQQQPPSVLTSPSSSSPLNMSRSLSQEENSSGNPFETNNAKAKYLSTQSFFRITKDVCGFPSFFNIPLYARILYLWNARQEELHNQQDPTNSSTTTPGDFAPAEVITLQMMEWFWKTEMEPYDHCDRFFNLVKQVDSDAIVRDDFLPFIKALLQDHPGLEFLSSHVEFQEKYAVTVITRIFYTVNKCHSGRITSRQVRLSDLVQAFQQVDEEEDINKVTRYFSYEHFYVLYCRFWELDHDRDYRITRDDLLKYGDQSLSHMIVDRIFDAAPRPFEQQLQQQQQGANSRDYLSYEDFIYFMLSEEDKANEVSVKYWFTCVDVDGDGKLNNMELRAFYAVQLHRMQFMGHEIVPFEDMLCQMMDMIKPQNSNFLVESDFLQPECQQVSGALFDALFNLNKYLLFEQRDPFVERQKREDEFDCDWDRFACLDYSRLAMEEEAREEEAMEIDWVSVDDPEGAEDDSDDVLDDDDDDDSESDLQGTGMLGNSGGAVASEAPF
mmetsp:Transcript_10862/g.30039  ORF Transcript_10862/g.30039 Transcript_10862/m.30039 type:complete len:697 (+) Transcript_10862:92-2182(+)